jgi:hypothetical protein|tara:strand:- start:53 stop:385 length:333 start_codon:yes stop_codon:yes gene_type:complete
MVSLIALGSVIFNVLMGWYLVRLLRKFLYISENMADLYLAFKSFEIFTESLYSMDTFYGEPVIQELIGKTKDVREELELFRETFEYTLDDELEEQLDEIAAEAQEAQEIN